MGFSGTQEKCKACDKTVHLIELVSADGVPYHKTCFKCSHCNGKLVISSFSSMDGVLYCKPHFEQLFKETGSYSKKFQQSGKSSDQKPNALSRTPSKLSHRFSGTQDKCALCQKTAYPLEKLTVEGESYHKSCFRCSHGGCFLTPSSYAALDGILYCKHHFAQLFKEKGSYNHLNKIASMKRDAAVPLPELKEQARAPYQEPRKAQESGPEDKPKSEQKQ
ncbi:LIM domain-containing protein WLIM2b-like [Syzygium oleosum]|uniref:LIM domain-containing protein WLIM2b-like n=1 Tax=Syzygium oleosum TaxID=219896 RepID=UPI0011D25B92|nr:LIM domain-containing protein WLIM2b-like [Syzygium oleosum]